jgi:thioredoxin 1
MELQNKGLIDLEVEMIIFCYSSAIEPVGFGEILSPYEFHVSFMDDELQQIREKKLREMQEAMGMKKKVGILLVEETNFQEFISRNTAVVIDFWAEWCGPCRMVGPIVEKLAREFEGRVVFGKCNTDHNPRIAMNFQISAIPTLLFFSDGKLVNRVIGAYPEEALRAQVAHTFGSKG